MNQKIKTLIIVVVLILLIGGAYALYHQLSGNISTNQLILQTQPTVTPTSSDDTVPTDTAPESLPLAPDFTIYDLDGNEVRLSDYFGKPIVVNFWASWCGPCKMEMPDFHEKFLELGTEVTFLMINMTDGSRETVSIASKFIEDQGYTFPVFYDTRFDAALTYGVYSLPTTYFIDAQGHAIAQAVGAIDMATLQKGIDMITS